MEDGTFWSAIRSQIQKRSVEYCAFTKARNSNKRGVNQARLRDSFARSNEGSEIHFREEGTRRCRVVYQHLLWSGN
jgi:hypothetical protein